MTEPNREQAEAIYRMMLRIRAFEERVAASFAAGEIPGFIHLSVGQEAVPATVCALLRPDDLIAATHRGHGQVLAKGSDPKRLMAEIFGRDTGFCGGRGGSMHICDLENGVLGTNGVVGAALPIAVGTALASQIRTTGQVTVAFFGDGAANTGAAHEALNLASVWGLPVVFICENNQYAEFTPQTVHTKMPNIAGRAAAYAMPGVTVDGNDVLAVWEAACEAIDRARSGGGPSLVEALTYRWRGHHEGDQMRYRPPDELAAWQAKDPVVRFRTWLVGRGWLCEDEDLKTNRLVQVEANDVVAFARSSPFPSPDRLLDNVYA